MYDKAVDTCPFVFDYVLDWYNTQEICDKFVSKDTFILDIRPKNDVIKLMMFVFHH